jgi:hypothetical protein
VSGKLLSFLRLKKSTTISVDGIHEWIHDHLSLDESENTRHVNGIKRQVFINVYDEQRVKDLVKRNNGQFACEHTNGEISSVKICPAGLRLDRIRQQIYPLKFP